MKLLALALFGFVIAESYAVSFFEVVVEEWEGWKTVHQKSYHSAEEEKFRMKIFMENKQKIAKHNTRFHKGHHNYQLEMNHYGDLLAHEFQGMMNGYRMDLKQNATLPRLLGATYISPANVQLPKNVDWRTSGAVTPVKNQGQCGSCWSFSATGSLEGQHFRKTGKLVSLSEQNLVDCSTRYGNHGCNGGLMDFAFKYIKENGGIDTEESYPYEGMDDTCRYHREDKGATDIGFVDIPQGDEEALKAALATVGPVSIAIDASQSSFQFYSDGVYDEPNCSPMNLDHGVLAVGYGIEEGQDYWLVKNSWGTEWGDQGFIKMARNKDNQCGVASAASYPQV
jgi:cathepsin L